MTTRSTHARAGLLATVLILAAGLVPPAAEAVLTIRITEGREDAQPIAVVPFGWIGGVEGPPARIGEIIAANLGRSGSFAPIPTSDLPARPTSVEEVQYADWRVLGAAHLVVGSTTWQGGDRYAVEFRLLDVFRGQQLGGYRIEAGAGELRRVAHQFSDLIYQELTGERGAFDTRIAYVTERKDADGNPRYALNVADSDGHDPRTVLESSQPVLSPDWSPSGRRLAYVSYEGGRSRIFIQDLATGAREEIAAFPGINGAPAFSPDGNRLALTLSKDGSPEIYVMELASRRLQRLTVSGSIDTEPSWSPDGRHIAFTSDRGGRPQIYRIPARGGDAERVTFEGNYNARPRYSPDGRRLALMHGQGGGFRIGVLELDTGALRILTDTNLDESPSFAPNGSMILYATVDSGGQALAAVSTDGRVRQRLASPGDKVREAVWSPFRAR